MAEHPLQGMMDITMDKVREMVDSSTIIGDPIKVDQETTIIPVSRVRVCFRRVRCRRQSQQGDVWRRVRGRGVDHAGCIPYHHTFRRAHNAAE